MRNFNFLLIIFSIFLLIITSVYATPVRIIGMASLNLLLEDESNRLNLFDYGGNVAALFDDEEGSSIETYISYGSIKDSDSSGALKDASHWGINIPSYSNVTINPLTNISGLPISTIFTYRMEEGFAFSGTGAFSSSKTKYESTDTEDEASMPIGGLIASRNFGLYSAGASAGYTKIRFTNNKNADEIYATLKGFDVGGSTHLSPLLDIGISAGFAIPDGGLKSKFLGQKYENTFKGKAYSVGVQSIAKIPGLLKLGAKFNFLDTDLDGKTELGNASFDIGDAATTNFVLGSRLLFSSILLPIKAGINLDYISLHPVYNSKDTTFPNLDNTTTTTNFGFCVSYAIPFFTPGIQYDLYNSSSTDNLANNGKNRESGMWDLRFGGELNLQIISLRGGYIIAKEDPDKDIENNESNSRSITFGAGIRLPMQPFKIEVAYVNKETEPVDNPAEQKTTDNTIYVAFKAKF